MSILYCKFHLFEEKNNQLLQAAGLTYLYLKTLSLPCLYKYMKKDLYEKLRPLFHFLDKSPHLCRCFYKII